MERIIDMKVRDTQVFHFNLCHPAAVSGEISLPQSAEGENMTLFRKVGKMLEI